MNFNIFEEICKMLEIIDCLEKVCKFVYCVVIFVFVFGMVWVLLSIIIVICWW